MHDDETKAGISKRNYMKIYFAITLALLLVVSYNMYQSTTINSIISHKVANAKEAARAAEMQIVVIEDSKCSDCFKPGQTITSVRNANVNITKEEFLGLDSKEARDIISKYNIDKVPAILLFGEVDKPRLSNFEKRDDAMVFTGIMPPYTDLKSNKVEGRVSSIILKDSSCTKCIDLEKSLDELKKSGISIVSTDVIEKRSDKGKEMIKDYSIDIIPTLILSKDLAAYNSPIVRNWKLVGTVEDDGSYVTRMKTPVYINLTMNRMVGLVQATFIVDESCEECYDPKIFHISVLGGLGVEIEKNNTVDVAGIEGKSLVEKYRIEKLPTVLLKGDVDAYPVLVNAWKNVGTVESDGTYVFRSVELAKEPYKDVKANKVVELEKNQ